MRNVKKMQRTSRAMFESLESRQLLSTTVNIPATSDLWIAAGLSGAGAGTAPTNITLPAGASRVLTFSSVTGTVSANTSITATAGPDGYTTNVGTTDLSTVKGISGIVDTATTGDFDLIGVFTGNTVPTTGAPVRLRYSGPPTAASYAPTIDQTFAIGDGKTGTGSGTITKFNVPAGATHLYLGFGDGSTGGAFHGTPGFYSDNGGSLNATLTIAVPTAAQTVSGSVLKDVNGAAGAGLANWRVYVDSNKNDRYDSDEPSAPTDSNGNFSLTLAPGDYTLAVEIENGYAIASPSTLTYAVHVSGTPVTGLKFVMKPVTPAL